jgi:hypothetical protein
MVEGLVRPVRGQPVSRGAGQLQPASCHEVTLLQGYVLSGCQALGQAVSAS